MRNSLRSFLWANRPRVCIYYRLRMQRIMWSCRPSTIEATLRRIAILFAVVILTACGDTTAPSSLVWTSVPSPTTKRLQSIWGSSPTNIWAVGEALSNQTGDIIHYNGTSWSTVMTGTFLSSVWGTSASDVWAVGCCDNEIMHFNGTAWSNSTPFPGVLLEGVWGTSPSNVWAVGTGGTILHYDGTTWSSVASGTTADLFSVWGTSSSNVWVAGQDMILHYDGSSWSVNFDYRPFAVLLTSVWGSSATDVWALGSAGIRVLAFHYDGSVWSEASPPVSRMISMWGTGPTNLWAVGVAEIGTGVSHWDGNSWTSIDVGSPQGRLGIWGSSASNIWIVGSQGSILHGRAAH
jgi:hypothetical protein